jgi:hypothetical protein
MFMSVPVFRTESGATGRTGGIERVFQGEGCDSA